MSHLLLEETVRDLGAGGGGAKMPMLPLSPLSYSVLQQHSFGDQTQFSVHHNPISSSTSMPMSQQQQQPFINRQRPPSASPSRRGEGPSPAIAPPAGVSRDSTPTPRPRTVLPSAAALPQQQQQSATLASPQSSSPTTAAMMMHQPSPSKLSQREEKQQQQPYHHTSMPPSHSSSPVDTWTSLNRAVALGIHAATVRHLTIERVELADSPWRWLLTVLPQLPFLEHLSLKDTAMNDARLMEFTGLVCYTISRGAPTPAAIRHANLSRGGFDGAGYASAGGSSTAPSLTSMTRLTSLNLADNYLTHKSALAIGKFCMWNLMNLQALDLSNNALGDHGAQVLAVYLSKMAPLRPSEAPITSRTLTAVNHKAKTSFASRPRADALKLEAQQRSELETMLNNMIKMVRPSAVDDAVEGLMSLCPKLRARAATVVNNSIASGGYSLADGTPSPNRNRVIPGGHHEKHHRFGLVSLDVSENRLTPRGVAEILTSASKSQIRLVLVARNSGCGPSSDAQAMNTSAAYDLNVSSATTQQHQQLLGSGLAARSQIPIVSLATLSPSLHCRLRVLDMSSCGLGTVVDLPTVRRLLLAILFASQHLETLDVGDNPGLGDVLARLLYDMGWEAAENQRSAPRSLSRITHLRIANTNLGDIGAATLIHALLDFDDPIDVLGQLQAIDFSNNHATLSAEAHANLVRFFTQQEVPVAVGNLERMCSTHRRLQHNTNASAAGEGEADTTSSTAGPSAFYTMEQQQQQQYQAPTPPPSPPRRASSFKVEKSPDRGGGGDVATAQRANAVNGPIRGTSPKHRASSVPTAAPTPASVADISRVQPVNHSAYDSPDRLEIVEEDEAEAAGSPRANEIPYNQQQQPTRSRTRSPYATAAQLQQQQPPLSGPNGGVGNSRYSPIRNSGSGSQAQYAATENSPQTVWRQSSASPPKERAASGNGLPLANLPTALSSTAAGAHWSSRISPLRDDDDAGNVLLGAQKSMTPPTAWARGGDDRWGREANEKDALANAAATNYLGIYSAGEDDVMRGGVAGGRGLFSPSSQQLEDAEETKEDKKAKKEKKSKKDKQAAIEALAVVESAAEGGDANADDDDGKKKKKKTKKVSSKRKKSSASSAARDSDNDDEESIAPSEITNESRSVSPVAEVMQAGASSSITTTTTTTTATLTQQQLAEGDARGVTSSVSTQQRDESITKLDVKTSGGDVNATDSNSVKKDEGTPQRANLYCDPNNTSGGGVGSDPNASLGLGDVSPPTPRTRNSCSASPQREVSESANHNNKDTPPADEAPSPIKLPQQNNDTSVIADGGRSASLAHDAAVATSGADVSFVLEDTPKGEEEGKRESVEAAGHPESAAAVENAAAADADGAADDDSFLPLFVPPRKDPSKISGRVKALTLTYTHPPGHILCRAWAALHLHHHCEALWDARVGPSAAVGERARTLALLKDELLTAAKNNPSVYGPILALEKGSAEMSESTLKLFYRTALTERAMSLRRALVADVSCLLQPSAGGDGEDKCVESVVLDDTDEMMAMCTFTIKTNERRVPIAQRLQDNANRACVEPSSSHSETIAAALSLDAVEGDQWKHLRHYLKHCMVSPDGDGDDGGDGVPAASGGAVPPDRAKYRAPAFTQDEVEWFSRLATALHEAQQSGALAIGCSSSCHLLHDHHGREDALMGELPEEMLEAARRLQHHETVVKSKKGSPSPSSSLPKNDRAGDVDTLAAPNGGSEGEDVTRTPLKSSATRRGEAKSGSAADETQHDKDAAVAAVNNSLNIDNSLNISAESDVQGEHIGTNSRDEKDPQPNDQREEIDKDESLLTVKGEGDAKGAAAGGGGGDGGGWAAAAGLDDDERLAAEIAADMAAAGAIAPANDSDAKSLSALMNVERPPLHNSSSASSPQEEGGEERAAGEDAKEAKPAENNKGKTKRNSTKKKGAGKNGGEEEGSATTVPDNANDKDRSVNADVDGAGEEKAAGEGAESRPSSATRTQRDKPKKERQFVDEEEARAATVPAEALVPIEQVINERHQQQLDASASRGDSFLQTPYADTPQRPEAAPQLDRAAVFESTLKEQRTQLLLALCYNSVNEEHISLDESRRNKVRVGKGKLRGKDKVSIAIEWDQLLVIKRYRGFSEKQLIFTHPLVCSTKATTAGPKSKELILVCEQPYGPDALGDKVKGSYQGTPAHKQRLVVPDTTPGHERLLVGASESNAAATAAAGPPSSGTTTPARVASGTTTPMRSNSPQAAIASQAQQFADRRVVTLSITLPSHKEVLKAIEVIQDHTVISHAHFDKMIQKRMDEFHAKEKEREAKEKEQQEQRRGSTSGRGAQAGASAPRPRKDSGAPTPPPRV